MWRNKMIKIIIGIIIGIGLSTYYPEISSTLKDFFLDSGARDSIVETLKEVK